MNAMAVANANATTQNPKRLRPTWEAGVKSVRGIAIPRITHKGIAINANRCLRLSPVAIECGRADQSDSLGLKAGRQDASLLGADRVRIASMRIVRNVISAALPVRSIAAW